MVSQEWDEPCHHAFGELKRKLSLPPVLKIPNFNDFFEVHTDDNDFVVSEMLMQDGRFIAYKDNNLNGYQRRWPTHEK